MATTTAAGQGDLKSATEAGQDPGRQPARGWLCLVAVAVLLAGLAGGTRLPLAPRYLFSFDSVNFALALDHFDPRLHQPQPPGYPMFVAQARLLRLIFDTPERTFTACGVLAAFLAPLLLFFLGRRMFSTGAGLAAALLLLLNPVFWHSTLASPLRPYLAVVSILVAWFCYRAASGEARFAFWAAVALGLGGGWRPALAALLFPMWLFCAWRGLRSPRRLALAALCMVAAVLAWFAPLAISMGGPASTLKAFAGYLGEQSEGTSLVYGSGFWGWWKMFTQAFVWQALAVVGWFWVLPLAVARIGPKPPARSPGDAAPRLRTWLFLLLWAAPTVAFFILIHVAHPGHTLSVVPALCLLGGAVIERGALRVARFLPGRHVPRAAFVAAALAINLHFFLYPFRIPHARPQVRGTPAQVREQFRFWGAFALHDSSYRDIRAEDQRTAERVELLRSLGLHSRDLVIVWQEDDTSWRKITYYFADTPTWMIDGISGPNAGPRRTVWLWQKNRIVQAPRGDQSDPVRLPAAGRVAWLLHLHSPFPDALRAQQVPLRQFGRLYLTELSSAPERFHAAGVSFQKLPRAPQ